MNAQTVQTFLSTDNKTTGVEHACACAAVQYGGYITYQSSTNDTVTVARMPDVFSLRHAYLAAGTWARKTTVSGNYLGEVVTAMRNAPERLLI